MPDFQKPLDPQGRYRRVADTLPGFKGYATIEAREETHAALSSHISIQLQQERHRLQDLSVRLAAMGDLAGASAINGLLAKLDPVKFSVQTGVGRYRMPGPAAFAALDLDALRDADDGVLDQVDAVKQAVDGLLQGIGRYRMTADALAPVQSAIDSLNTAWVKRRELTAGR